MFKKKIYALYFVWTVLAIGLVLFISFLSQEQHGSYDHLMDLQKEVQDTPASGQIKQHRTNVSKHFLRSYETERLQMHVRSESSDLLCDQNKGKSEIVELFKGMSCLAQEELTYQLIDGQDAKMQKNGRLLLHGKDGTHNSDWIDVSNSEITPKQRIRQIDAENASYHYRSENLFADTVKISQYIAPGHQLIPVTHPSSFLMKGTASQIEFSLGNGNKPFKAQQLRATFQAPESIR